MCIGKTASTAQEALAKRPAKLQPGKRTAENPARSSRRRKRSSTALRKYRRGAYTGVADRLWTWFLLGGITVFDRFTPSTQRHTVWLAPLFACLLATICAYMTGAYPTYQASSLTSPADEPGQRGVMVSKGADALRPWMVYQHGWQQMDDAYLVAWGAVDHTPGHSPQGWRLWSSLLINRSWAHIVVLLIILLPVSFLLEQLYGTWRLALVALLTGPASVALAVLTRRTPAVHAGADGLVVGLLAFWVVDTLRCWSSRARHSWLSGAWAVVAIAIYVAFEVLQHGHDFIASAYGVLLTMPLAMLMMHDLKAELLEACVPYACLIVVGVAVVALLLASMS